MMNKLKNIAIFYTCITILIGVIFGIFKAYDKIKGKVNQINFNSKKISLIVENEENIDNEIEGLKLQIKKLRIKNNGAKKILAEEIEEEEAELKENKRKKFLGVF